MSASQPTTDTAVAAIHDWRELASREGDGLEIALLWSKTAGRVKVTVADSRLDEAFELEKPRSSARRRSSASKWVLPMPGSPCNATHAVVISLDASRAASRCASADSRPIV